MTLLLLPNDPGIDGPASIGGWLYCVFLGGEGAFDARTLLRDLSRVEDLDRLLRDVRSFGLSDILLSGIQSQATTETRNYHSP